MQESNSTVAQSPLARLAPWAIVGLAAVAFVLLLFTDRSALQGRRASDLPSAEAQPAAGATFDATLLPASLQGLALPPTPTTAEGQAIGQLLKKLAAAPDADKAQLLGQLVAACLNLGRYDLAAGLQQALAERTGAEADWHQALRLYAQAAERAPQIGLSPQDAATQNQRAVTLAESWLSTHPNDLTAQVQMALLHVNSGDPSRIMPKGIQALVKISDQHPEQLEATLALGRFSLQTGQLDRAVARLQSVLKTNPGHPEAALLLSRALARQNKSDQARTVLNDALAKTRDPQWMAQLQAALREIGNPQ